MRLIGRLCLSTMSILLLGGFADAKGPSFDCTTAGTKIEKMICADEMLSMLDLGLAKIYAAALKNASDPTKVRQQQRDWIEERNTCPDKGCLQKKYRARILTLKHLAASPAATDEKRPKASKSKSIAFNSAAPTIESSLTLLRITPDGNDVPVGRQIVFQFDRPVVPVGRMERDAADIPIQITPAVQCEWRWINTSALACQLTEENALRPATDYSVDVNPGIVTEDGASMTKPVTHRFITERPRVDRVSFEKWRAPGWPRVRLTFNQAVTRSSVKAHIRLDPSGFGAKDYGMTVEPSAHDRTPVLYAPFPGEPYGLLQPEYRSTTIEDRKTEHRGEEARRVWVVAPQQELPLDSDIYLQVKPGLVSAMGPEPGIESRVALQFHTYPEFRFMGIECTHAISRKDTLLIPSHRSSDPLPDSVARCAPLQPVALVFSAPVIHQEVQAHLRVLPDLAGGRTDYDPWANAYSYSRLGYAHRKGQRYRIRLPENLKADHRYEIISDEVGIKDEFGRGLATPIDMAFRTAHRQPRLVLNHQKIVLEKHVDTDVPVVVTNLKTLKVPHRAITADGQTHHPDYQSPVAPAQDVSFAMRLGVRDMLGNRSGAVVGHIDSEPRVHNYSTRRYRFFAQITPFQVHVKLGHFSSMAWVTDLATGEPVEGAKLSVYVDSYTLRNLVPSAGSDAGGNPAGKIEFPSPPGTRATAVSNSDGIALLPGTKTLDPDLDLLRYAWQDDRQRLFIRIDKGADFALVPLDGNFATRPGGIGSQIRKEDGHLHAWGTTAQGVYKVGDTVQYKFYVRNQSNRHWVAPPTEGYSLKVIDPKGETVETVDSLALSKFGAYSGEFTLSDKATVGWYRFMLENSGTETQTLEALRVLVSDFTPSPFRVTTELNGRQFEPGEEIEVTTYAKLHAGGPYTNAETRTTVRLHERRFASNHQAAKGFTFEPYGRHRKTALLHQSTENGDDRGEVTARFTLNDQSIYFGLMSVESAVRDDRGKFVAARSSARYYGRDRYAGLRNTRWTYDEDQEALIEYLVVDRDGAPVAGTPVDITIEHEEVRASRVKGAGNAYLTKYIKKWVVLDNCQGVSTGQVSTCTFTPEKPGRYRFTATISDTRQRKQSTKIGAWVVGKGEVFWQEPDDYSLQVIPEESQYKVGDTARFLIKNPFPGARALVTVERYGVLRHWIITLDGGTPVIEIPVEADFLPGFYLSVLVNSPRVDQPMGDGNVDLGKPTFRQRYVKVPVRDVYKEIDIQIRTDKEVYKPRETVKARINAVPRHDAKDRPIENAVVVIDEAVFDLNARGRDYYDPYKGFNRLDPLDLNNYSLLTRLVGRQKFEQKGANPGGGGSRDGPTLRNLFKFVSYWNPSIFPDKDGCTDIAFDLPDNLTGWRIFALAVTPDDRMGLGDTNIKVNQPTELRPVMPNQVTEGDTFVAGFSVMNRTESARTVTVAIKAVGSLAPSSKARTEVEVLLEPYKRKTVWLSVKTKGPGEIGFLATAGDSLDGDAVEHHVPVNRRRSLITAANYGTTTRSQVSDAVAFPENIHTDVGGIRVVTSPTVIGNLDGAFSYIRDYPYACWEQLLTKAVMASHYNNLRVYLPDDLVWADSTSLPQEMLDRAASFQAANGGMTYWLPDNRYVSPYLSAYTTLAFNWLRSSGYQVPEELEGKLHDYLTNMLRRDVMPTFFSKGMASSVRAVALAALAEHGKVNHTDLLRYEPHLPEMDLFGKAHFLQAASTITGARPSAVHTAKLILSHASQSGGKFQFNEPWDDSYSYILATPLRSNCAILSSLMALTTDTEMLGLVGDVPFKQVRAITQSRGSRNNWENTQENVFCMNAITDYARVYENETPDMTVNAYLGDRPIGETHYTDLRDEAVVFEDIRAKIVPGLKTDVTLTKHGPGRLYYATRLSYAPTIDSARRINSGIEIRREYSVERSGTWTLLASPMHIRRGELVRVDIYVSLPTLRHFVVVDDPIPGGLEPVNQDLATASVEDADKGKFKAADGSFWFSYSDWSYYGVYGYSFYHKELRHHAARFYADYLPAGNYHLSYTAQAIAEGEFSVMPIHAEEMYDPDVFGKGLPHILRVDAP